MRMEKFERRADWSGIVLVRLLRRWVALREAGVPTLPAMVERAGELGIPPEAAVALSSVLELTEACLGRPLSALCCSSHEIGADERALLLMLALAPEPSGALASRDIPHGLPSALGWAVASLRRVVGGSPFRLASALAECPFSTAPAAPAAASPPPTAQKPPHCNSMTRPHIMSP
ncbi:hypothetical protein [Sphingosinicella terrae]|uniref:hypothetical protein n=1 Tax=Sphingosinicella terrae TaxID=2172047 RepID=UPI000E0DDA1B|nr:hypothetical protein [Sphingosinicella terrae]